MASKKLSMDGAVAAVPVASVWPPFDCVCNNAWELLDKRDQASLRLISKEAAFLVDARIVELTGIASDEALHAASTWAVFLLLQKIRIQGCADLAPLSMCTELRVIDMSSCRAVSDLAPLSMCKRLQVLSVKDCDGVSELAPMSA